ncbi:MAG: sugar phosphate isomerase/epimerase [Armatimonadetes bacterium]|nr:sugar phosphate isomerase/epimerase [Armatimonadota bacterium]
MAGGISRRRMLGQAVAGGAALALGRMHGAAAQEPAGHARPWVVTLNTSTVRPASLDDKIRAAEAAGYDGLELWSNELEDHAKAGGSLEALGKRLADAGLKVPNIIGLWNCMPESDAERPAAHDRVRRQMEDAAKVGAAHIAAVPSPDRPSIDLLWAADRYRELLEIGEGFGVVPAVEFVGFFQGINRLGQAAAIGIEANHPQACLVADTFHLFRGASGFDGVRHLSGTFIACFHFNDAPAQPPRTEQGDDDRVLPGDGVLPLPQLLRDLRAIGFNGPLSLELFNRPLWERDPVEVARLGMSKIRAVIEKADELP